MWHAFCFGTRKAFNAEGAEVSLRSRRKLLVAKVANGARRDVWWIGKQIPPSSAALGVGMRRDGEPLHGIATGLDASERHLNS